MSDKADSNLPPVDASTSPDTVTPSAAVPPPVATPDAEPQVGSVPSAAAFKTKPDFGKHSVPAYQMPDDTPWKQTWRIFQARLQSLSEQVGRRLTQRTLKIGVSARIFHPETGAKGLQAKTL